MSEHDLAVSLFGWAAVHESKYPALKLLHHTQNGLHTSHIGVARKAIKAGLRRGVPDICLPFPRAIYHGLWAELKWGKNKLTKEQMLFLDDLKSLDYYTCVWYDIEQAIEELQGYLLMPPFISSVSSDEWPTLLNALNKSSLSLHDSTEDQ